MEVQETIEENTTPTLNVPPSPTHIRFPDEEEPLTTQPQSKLGQCEVCAALTAKYTCPRCEVKTCCLKCALIHKRELDCNGVRDRAKFIPINKFTNLDLTSDFRLLEEVERSLQASKKLRWSYGTNETLPHHLFKLKNSLKRKQITLNFLPFNFDRHRKNTTKVNFTTDVVFWHLEWVFTNADNLRLVDDEVKETERLGKVVRKYLEKQEETFLQERLQYYQSAGFPGVKILLRAENKKGLRFYELDPCLTLKECFRGKTIIEFPVIQLVLKDHVYHFEVIDTDYEDDDIDTDPKFGDRVVNRIVKKSEESDENIYKAMRNLLFISEHSDNENEMSD